MFQNGPLDKYCACCGEKLISIPRKRRNRGEPETFTLQV